jgi:hypothetical protein
MVKVQRGEVVRRERLAREMEVEFSDIDPEHLDLALQRVRTQPPKCGALAVKNPFKVNLEL